MILKFDVEMICFSFEFDVSSIEWALPSPPKYHTFEEVPGIKVSPVLKRASRKATMGTKQERDAAFLKKIAYLADLQKKAKKKAEKEKHSAH